MGRRHNYLRPLRDQCTRHHVIMVNYSLPSLQPAITTSHRIYLSRTLGLLRHVIKMYTTTKVFSFLKLRSPSNLWHFVLWHCFIVYWFFNDFIFIYLACKTCAIVTKATWLDLTWLCLIQATVALILCIILAAQWHDNVVCLSVCLSVLEVIFFIMRCAI